MSGCGLLRTGMMADMRCRMRGRGAASGAAILAAMLVGYPTSYAQPAQEQPPVAEYRLELPSLAEELGQPGPVQPENAPDAASLPDSTKNKQEPADQLTGQPDEPAAIDRAIEAFPLPIPGEPDPESAASKRDGGGMGADQSEGRAGDADKGAAAAILDAARHKRVLLRGLDKITGRIVPIDLPVNTPISFGSLRITARDCHKTPPEETPEISAFLEISDVGLMGQSDLLTEGQRAVLVSEEGAKQVFSGWMFASSPAISALEHPVYDVWVIDCIANSPDNR